MMNSAGTMIILFIAELNLMHFIFYDDMLFYYVDI